MRPLSVEVVGESDAARLIKATAAEHRRLGANTFIGDNIATFYRNHSFAADERFVDIVDRNAFDNHERAWLWRMHTLCWAAGEALKLPGDFVECGCFRGFMAAVICEYLDFQHYASVTGKHAKTFTLYDTFAGLPEEWSTTSERKVNDAYHDAPSYELATVRRRFERYPNVKVYKGVVPDILASTAPDHIAFLHLDMNAAAAEIGALDCLFDCVVPGGFVVLDDYGHQAHVAQHEAEKEWAERRSYGILELPTGQGLMIKRGRR